MSKLKVSLHIVEKSNTEFDTMHPLFIEEILTHRLNQIKEQFLRDNVETTYKFNTVSPFVLKIVQNWCEKYEIELETLLFGEDVSKDLNKVYKSFAEPLKKIVFK